jgi:hypothetical protein
MSDAQPVKSRRATHIDIYDASCRRSWAEHFGITDQQLRKAVHLAGSRISTVAGHLGKPVR